MGAIDACIILHRYLDTPTKESPIKTIKFINIYVITIMKLNFELGTYVNNLPGFKETCVYRIVQSL